MAGQRSPNDASTLVANQFGFLNQLQIHIVYLKICKYCFQPINSIIVYGYRIHYPVNVLKNYAENCLDVFFYSFSSVVHNFLVIV